MKLKAKRIVLYTFLVMSISWSLQGQITITANDILGVIGKTQVIEQDSSGTIVVNVGGSGPNQVWDFSASNPDALVATYEHLQPNGTPFSSDFPSANMVEKISFTGAPGTIYNYREVTDNQMSNLGSATDLSLMGVPFSRVTKSRRTLAPLPLAYENTWSEMVSDTNAAFGIVSIISDTSTFTVDAWGTVILPKGQVPVLRIRQDSRGSSSSVVAGFNQTTRSADISYFWVSRDNLIVAWATSEDGETDPNFTTTSFFALLSEASGTTSLTDNEPTRTQVLTAAPNPFLHQTEFRFTLMVSEDVRLDVFDQAGRLVRSIPLGRLEAGDHQVRWEGNGADGQKLPAGAYTAVLHAGKVSSNYQLIKLK